MLVYGTRTIPYRYTEYENSEKRLLLSADETGWLKPGCNYSTAVAIAKDCSETLCIWINVKIQWLPIPIDPSITYIIHYPYKLARRLIDYKTCLPTVDDDASFIPDMELQPAPHHQYIKFACVPSSIIPLCSQPCLATTLLIGSHIGALCILYSVLAVVVQKIYYLQHHLMLR